MAYESYMGSIFLRLQGSECRMTVSKAVVPLLKGDASVSIQETISHSQIKPYTKEERDETLREIFQLLEMKKINSRL